MDIPGIVYCTSILQRRYDTHASIRLIASAITLSMGVPPLIEYIVYCALIVTHYT